MSLLEFRDLPQVVGSKMSRSSCKRSTRSFHPSRARHSSICSRLSHGSAPFEPTRVRCRAGSFKAVLARAFCQGRSCISRFPYP